MIYFWSKWTRRASTPSLRSETKRGIAPLWILPRVIIQRCYGSKQCVKTYQNGIVVSRRGGKN